MRIPVEKDGGLGLRDQCQGRGKKKVEGYLTSNRFHEGVRRREASEGRLLGSTREYQERWEQSCTKWEGHRREV